MTKDRKNSWGGIDAIPPIYQIKDNSSNKNNIFVMREDLIPISMGGNKVRIAAEFFLDMEEKGCDVMVAYGNLRSNLCRVIANQCYRKKIPCYIICSKEETDEEELETSNSRMMKLFDAKLVLCNKNNIAETVEKTLHEIEAGGHRPYYIYGNKYGTGNEGVPAGAYAKAYGKIKAFEKEARCSFDYIFHASGTGGTQAGLTCGHILEGDSAKVVGILISSRLMSVLLELSGKGLKVIWSESEKHGMPPAIRRFIWRQNIQKAAMGFMMMKSSAVSAGNCRKTAFRWIRCIPERHFWGCRNTLRTMR